MADNLVAAASPLTPPIVHPQPNQPGSEPPSQAELPAGPLGEHDEAMVILQKVMEARCQPFAVWNRFPASHRGTVRQWSGLSSQLSLG